MTWIVSGSACDAGEVGGCWHGGCPCPPGGALPAAGCWLAGRHSCRLGCACGPKGLRAVPGCMLCLAPRDCELCASKNIGQECLLPFMFFRRRRMCACLGDRRARCALLAFCRRCLCARSVRHSNVRERRRAYAHARRLCIGPCVPAARCGDESFVTAVTAVICCDPHAAAQPYACMACALECHRGHIPRYTFACAMCRAGSCTWHQPTNQVPIYLVK